MAREAAEEAVPVAEEALAVAVVLAEAEAAVAVLVALALVLLEQKVTFNNCQYSGPFLLEVPVNTLIRSN